jgi:dTDP-4-dehydrorhamnose reductase
MFKIYGEPTALLRSDAAIDDEGFAGRPVAKGGDRRPGRAMWGGVECTTNRVGDAFFTQIKRSAHDLGAEDLARFAALGLGALRSPLWEATAPDSMATANWSFADRRLPELRRLGITPIVGLVHHGSGPRHTSLLDPSFAVGLAEFAGTVAARYPWVDHWTPVNEPLTTARFSALYGIWYPHACDDRSFVAALFNQCRATVLAMASIRRVNPAAQLIQTDDLGCTYGTEPLANVVGFYNGGAGSPGTCCAAESTRSIRSGRTCVRAAPTRTRFCGSPRIHARPT